VFVFDLFRGKYIHTTELLESPLEKGNNTIVKEYSNISLSTLNYYDLITSKLFREQVLTMMTACSWQAQRKMRLILKHLKKDSEKQRLMMFLKIRLL